MRAGFSSLKIIIGQYAEALVWLCVLIAFAFTQVPQVEHFTLCLFHHAGLHWCPGCGIGRSMILLLHGNIAGSIAIHPFGIPAVILMIERIDTVLKTASAYRSVTENPLKNDLILFQK